MADSLASRRESVDLSTPRRAAARVMFQPTRSKASRTWSFVISPERPRAGTGAAAVGAAPGASKAEVRRAADRIADTVKDEHELSSDGDDEADAQIGRSDRSGLI